ncbi:FAD binding domain-containing protein [Diplocarpon mali]|nr:FAD binding domain-containing protein [Diplocarpon mali]
MKSHTLLPLVISSILVAAAPQTYEQQGIAPAGCRKLSTDADWPAPEVWAAAIPGVVPNSVKGTDKVTAGGVSDYRIRARSAQDVQNAVRFASQHNIRIAVITTGHDQVGRNDAASGLLIDLSLLRNVRLAESFTATTDGVPWANSTETNIIVPQEGVQAAVTFGPAVAGFPLNQIIAPSGLFSVTPFVHNVAVAGGWGQNGGYGPLTAQYGIGSDQWLEAKIVTPDGELRIANEVSNPDLFWAIRGGGGGTFGVVVEATWKVYPDVPITTMAFYVNSTRTGANASNFETGEHPMSKAMAYLMSEVPEMQKKGISGSFYVNPTSMRSFVIHPGCASGLEIANRFWGPILSEMSSFEDMTPFQTKAFHYQSYTEYFSSTYGPMPVVTANEPYGRGIIGFDSTLLAPEHLQSPDLTSAFRTTRGDYGVQVVTPGYKVGSGVEVAANPGWRRASALVVGMKDEAAGTSMDSLRELAPDMGAYINEVRVSSYPEAEAPELILPQQGSHTSKDWTSQFWGDNYPRLSALKKSIDPKMIFWVSPGINADHMIARDGRACIVDPYTQTSEIPPPLDRSVPANFTRDISFLFGQQERDLRTYPAPGTWLGLQNSTIN